MDRSYFYDCIMRVVESRVGEANAINQEALLQLLHVSCPEAADEIRNTRTLLEYIHDMRRKGYVVASGQFGYFKPLNRA